MALNEAHSEVFVKDSRLIDITGDTSLEKLRESIAKHDGTLLVCIHPFYRDRVIQDEDGPALIHDGADDLKVYNKTLHVLERALRRPLPVIIAERELGHGRRLGTFLDSLGKNAHQPLYLYLTKDDGWEPQCGFNTLRNILKELGVKRIVISGYYLRADDSEGMPVAELRQDLRNRFQQCVGHTAEELSREFPIRLTRNMTFPLRGDELKDSELPPNVTAPKPLRKSKF